MKSYILSAIVFSLVLVSGKGFAEERVGLAHQPLPSPDGKHLVFIAEYRYNETSKYTLTIRTENRVVYSLTPSIKEIIVAPDKKTIAYIAQDFTCWMGIYILREGRVFGLDYCETRARIEGIRFSVDGKYIGCDVKPSRGFGFKILKVMTLRGEHIHDNKGIKQIQWAPIEKPTKIPSFLTQPVPKINKQTQIKWSPDSHSIYVLDESGIWRDDIDIPGIYRWSKIVQAPSISTFQLSPDGKHLLYQIRKQDEEEQEIWLVGIDEKKPQQLGMGWSATFSHDGKSIFYADLRGLYEAQLDGARRELHPTAYRP